MAEEAKSEERGGEPRSSFPFLISLFIAIFIALFTALAANVAFARPSWFPAEPCRQAWKGRDLARYDFAKDARLVAGVGNSGYANYQKRIAQDSGVTRKGCYKEWTILVYMAADNDLSPYALWDLDEMEGRFESSHSAASTLKTDLVVEVDTDGPSGIRRLHMFQRADGPYVSAKTKETYVGQSPARVASPIVSIATEPDARTPAQKLEQFLEWGVREYPAENYMVIVWGHGQGWSADLSTVRNSTPQNLGRAMVEAATSVPQPKPGRFGGIMVDPNSSTHLSIPALRDVLDTLVQGTLEGERLALYASDACLMQMSEVAYEIAPSTRFVVGSSQVQSYLGLPYRRMLYELNTGRFLSVAGTVGRGDEPYLMAKMLPRLAEQSLDPVYGQQGHADPEAIRTFTMSALSSDELLGSVAPATHSLSRSLSAYLKAMPIAALEFASVLKTAPSFMGGGKELGSFLSLVENALKAPTVAAAFGDPVKTEALKRQIRNDIATVREAIDRTVVERAFGTGYTTSSSGFHLLGFRSVGIWIPTNAKEYKERASDFARSKFHQDTEWQAWLRPALGVKTSP